jgi:nucleotide-binding universal stress UspA family protein
VLQVRNVAPRRYPHVVLAADVGSALGEMVDAARFVAPATPMLFVHAYENPFESMLSLHGVARATLGVFRREYAKLSRERVREHMKAWDLGGAPLRLQHGSPRFVLRRVPRRALLVIHRGRSRLKHVFAGSVTHWVLEESACDVLVV